MNENENENDEAFTELLAIGESLKGVPEAETYHVLRACPGCGADVRVAAATEDAECDKACGWAGWVGDLDGDL